jgi:hypothetical protein
MTLMVHRRHLIEYDGGVISLTIGRHSDKAEFFNPMERFNGDDQWALTLSPTDDEMSPTDVAHTEYIQAAGSDAHHIMMDIRKPGGQQWGVEWVRYAIGHPHADAEPLDVPIRLPHGVYHVGRSEVFTADEAADLFFAFYTTGEIPPEYTLRPLDGYTAQGDVYDLSDGTPQKIR